MIGMIALAGIVVRNSIILIDFIHHHLDRGYPLEEAVLRSGAVRFRPILLTALAAMFGSWVITLDPIFSGLAWSFIFGLFASTAFSLVVVPLIFYLQAQPSRKLRGGPGENRFPRPPLKLPSHPPVRVGGGTLRAGAPRRLYPPLGPLPQLLPDCQATLTTPSS